MVSVPVADGSEAVRRFLLVRCGQAFGLELSFKVDQGDTFEVGASGVSCREPERRASQERVPCHL